MIKQDARVDIALDLSSAGGPRLVLQPRRGYLAYRAVDMDTHEVVACAALKELLHKIADRLPRQMALRNVE